MHLAIGSNLMFIALKSGSLAIINLETRKLVGRHNCHSDSSQNPAVSCTALTNTCLFTAMFDYTVMCWDITKLCSLKKMARDDKLQMLHKISTFTNTVLCLMINNNLLFCGSADKSLQVFDITTWERVRCLNCHGGAISGLQIMGNLLITSCFDKFVRCFDVQNFNLLQIYGGHSDMIFSLIANDGMVYTGCRDGKIRSIKIDLTVFYECKWIGCKLRFGVLNHLQDHLKDHCKGDSSLLAQCKWDKCTHNAKSFATLHNHLLTHLPSNNTK
jgi:WD40 repeat protein